MNKLLYVLLFLILLIKVASAQELLTNQSIVAMNQAKVSRSLIVEKINISRCQFDMSTIGLLSLASVDVPESVIEAMLATTKLTDVLHNEDVIRLHQAGLSRRLITQKIQSGPTQFNVNTDGVIQLKTAKVPEAIIKTMITGGTTPTPNSAKPSGRTPAKFSQATSPPSPPPKAAQASVVSRPDCNSWNGKFTKKTVKASRVTLRGWKPGAIALNTLVGSGAANALGVEDMGVHLIFRRDGDDLTLVLYASKPGIHTMLVSSDKPLMFLLQDESVINLLPAESSESDYSWGSGYSMDSEMLMYYHLDKEQAQLLSQKLIKEYRLNFYNRKFTQDKVNENRAMQVRIAAQCVL